MDFIPEAEPGYPRYQVWLQELDESTSDLRGPFFTVDQLYSALLARWDGKNQDSGELIP